jgi:hypothetical protein
VPRKDGARGQFRLLAIVLNECSYTIFRGAGTSPNTQQHGYINTAFHGFPHPCLRSSFVLNLKHLKMRKFVLSAVACSVVLFNACKKSDDPTPPANSKKDLVVNGKWKWTGLSSVVMVGGTETLVDGWSIVQDCDKDDIMTFSADGTGTIDEKALKCDPTAPQIKNITWEFLNNETQVKVTDDEGPQVLTIVELTATQAIYRQRLYTGTDSVTIQQTFTNVN